MSTVQALAPRSEELRRVDYLLKLSLRTQDIHDLSAWHFGNLRQATKFEEKVASMQTVNVLHAWIDAGSLDNSINTLESIATRGFIISNELGMKFITGTLPGWFIFMCFFFFFFPQY